ncbi:M56 family metallopeptidase [Pedobacter sp. Leaf250]|uniref:M56 family metallopeptidase n=1 Tax=Pedobacter sp. Leaf250 TaxID=2876559 RepID=UPI001E2F7DF8|nr:M56 family metallopeptidase [Pedobacter sp. Leaf250]
MNFKQINFLPENWLNALGATLFHSLWLGVVLAIFAGAIMFATRKASAKLRYNLLTGSLFLFVVAISISFYLELNTHAVETNIKKANELSIHLSTLNDNQINITGLQFDLFTILTNFLSVWNSYAFQIVLIWFLVICGKSIQLLAGLSSIHHLRNNQTYAAGKTWDEHLDLLSDKLGLHQQVKMVQSGIAKVPMVVGHFKPLILIPLGLLNGLSTVEVEAILAHELAHIKRRDYLVNLLQSFIEIVFFFNPAVLWVSQLIRTEREHCCDDLAISCVDDRKNYVKALIFCQEFKQCAPAYAMGINGKNGSLLHRASRMLLNTNSTLNKMEKTILTIALVSTVIFTAAFKNIGHAASLNKTTISTSILAMQDTAKKNKSADQMEKEIEQKMKAAEKKATEKGKQREDRDKRNRSYNQSQDNNDEVIRQAKIDAKQAVIDAEVARKDAAQAIIDAKVAKEDAKQAVIDAKEAEIDAAQYAREYKNDQKPPRAPKPPRQARPSAVPVSPSPPTPGAYAVPATPPTPPTPPKVSGSYTVNDGNKISAELLKDGLISNTKTLSFSLDKNNLIINGVKQKESIHKKYSEKYLENANQSMSYVRVDKVTKN